MSGSAPSAWRHDFLTYVARVTQHAGPEIVKHESPKRIEASEALTSPPACVATYRPSTPADLSLQGAELAEWFRWIDELAMKLSLFGSRIRRRGGDSGLPQVEVAAPFSAIVEDGVAHLQIGDGAGFRRLPHPVRLVFEVLDLGDPTVALPEDAYEERFDAVNPLPTVLPGIGGLAVDVFLRNAPTQVDVEELEPQLFDSFA